MKSGLAYSSSVVLPDGRLWITGGLDDATILETTEILEETKDGKWIIYEGPNLPKTTFWTLLRSFKKWQSFVGRWI